MRPKNKEGNISEKNNRNKAENITTTKREQRRRRRKIKKKYKIESIKNRFEDLSFNSERRKDVQT